MTILSPPSPSSISTHQALPSNLHAKVYSIHLHNFLCSPPLSDPTLPLMKNLKQVISVLVAMAKAKSTAVKSKTSAMKTRLMLFKILHDKKTLTSVLSQKVHSVKADENVNDYNKAVVEYKSTHSEMAKDMEEEEGEDDYPYLMDPIPELDEFDEKFADIGLENEIDKAADLFIRRFHRQIKIQKQESFKRYQEMLERSM